MGKIKHREVNMKALVAVIGIALLTATGLPALAQDQFVPGLRSVKIAVDDFNKAIAFYTALGMKEGPTHSATAREVIWEGSTRNSSIMMVSPDYPGRDSLVRGGAYLMVTTPDVQAVADKLRDAGFADIGNPRAMGSMVSILMLKDPDGNVIELMGPPPVK